MEERGSHEHNEVKSGSFFVTQILNHYAIVVKFIFTVFPLLLLAIFLTSVIYISGHNLGKEGS